MAMHIIKKRMGGATLPTSSGATPALPIQSTSLLDFSTTSLPPASFTVKPNSIPTHPQPNDADLLQGLSMGGAEKVAIKATTPATKFGDLSSLTSSVTASQAGNPILLPKAATAVSSSLEARDLEAKEKNLQIRHQELSAFQSQLAELKPNADEIKKKREQVDQEYRSITEKRNQVSIELSQLRAEYELDLETLRDRQGMLEGDRKTLAASQTEIAQYKEAISLIKKENASLGEKIDSQKKELASVLKIVAELESETAALRQTTHQLFDEARQQQAQMDYHNKILENGRQEHDIVKKNLDIEQGRLESDKKKVQQLEQQASVQQAIIEKEKLRMETMERERLENAKKSQDLMGSIQSMETTMATAKSAPVPDDNLLSADTFTSAADQHRPSLRDQILATAVSSENVVFPVDQPPPPIPPAATKPLKGSVSNLVESSLTPNAAAAESSSSSVFPNSTTSATSAGTPASALSKKERDSMDLDSLLSTNKPKAEKTPTMKAAVVAAPPPVSNVDFDSFFASAPTPDQQQKAKPPPPAAPTTSSTNAVLGGGTTTTNAKSADAVSLMEKAFASASLKQAKDTPSLASVAKTPTSASGSTILSTPAFPVTGGGGAADSFSFNSSFGGGPTKKQQPQQLPLEFSSSTATASKDGFGSGFKRTVDADFGDFKATPQTFPMSQDLDSVFGGSSSISVGGGKAKVPLVDSDPFGQSSFVPASTFSGGGNGSDAFGGFGSNPFDAFNTPFPAPTSTEASSSGPVPSFNATAADPSSTTQAENAADFQTVANSPSKGTDTPEVANIVAMGFTKEQAMNSLEAYVSPYSSLILLFFYKSLTRSSYLL